MNSQDQPFEAGARTAPTANMIVVARGVAAGLAAGESVETAVDRAADMLDVPRGAVAYACETVAAYFADAYLEGPEGWTL